MSCIKDVEMISLTKGYVLVDELHNASPYLHPLPTPCDMVLCH